MILWSPVCLTLGSAGLFLLMLKLLYRRSVVCHCRANQPKHVIITGANSGIGRATAFELARQQWRITLACRDAKAAEALRKELVCTTENSQIQICELDLTQRASIDRFIRNFTDVRVDALVNNAGIMASCAQAVDSFNNLNIDTVTNYLSVFYLTLSMLPTLSKSYDEATGYPRVIFVNSSLSARGNVDNILLPNSAKTPWNTSQAYADSKLATCLFARELHRRCGSGPEKMLNVYTIFTGGMVNTQLSRHVLSQYPSVIQKFCRFLSRSLLMTPEYGCQSVVHCTVSPDVPMAHLSHSSATATLQRPGSGLLFKKCVPVEWPVATRDASKAQWLWDETARFLNMNPVL